MLDKKYNTIYAAGKEHILECPLHGYAGIDCKSIGLNKLADSIDKMFPRDVFCCSECGKELLCVTKDGELIRSNLC